MDNTLLAAICALGILAVAVIRLEMQLRRIRRRNTGPPDTTRLPDDAVRRITRLVIDEIRKKPLYKSLAEGDTPDTTPLLERRIETVGFERRTSNALRAQGIQTVGDLVARRRNDLLGLRGFGTKTMYDIDRFIAANGLKYGMTDLPKKRPGPAKGPGGRT